MRRYFKLWLRMAAMSLQAQLAYRFGSVGFLVGKLMRLAFFFAFVIAIFSHTNSLAGYSLIEMALFFLTFNIVDIAAQVFFKGVYSARRTISDGDFDFYLIQPCSPLFRMAGSTVDFLDVATLLPVLAMIAVVFGRMPGEISAWRLAAYLALTLNGLAIALAIHILVGALAVRTQELESTIWVYRDLMFMGKFPIDIYAGPARWVLTWIIPIGVMVSFPAKALLGVLSLQGMAYAFLLAGVLLALSAWFWRDSVRQYTSSSS